MSTYSSYISCGPPIVFQKPAGPLPADDFTSALRRWFNDFIVQTLVKAFSMVMLHIFLYEILQMTLS